MKELQPLVRLGAQRHLGKRNVVGVGLGYKETGGKLTDQPAIIVMVMKKEHRARLRRADLVPKTLAGTKTDVIEVGDLRLLPALEVNGIVSSDDADRRTRLRPARPGASVGHYQVTAGTFGALVYDQDTGSPLVLSNNHVLANLTDGRDGRAKQGDPIYQPGRYDGGSSTDTIAHLERFSPIVRATAEDSCPIARRAEKAANLVLRMAFQGYRVRLGRLTGAENRVDAAVAALTGQEEATPDILGLGPPGDVTEARPGLRVVKSGRTTGVSPGEVRVIGATVRIGLGEVGSAVFTEQIVTTPMAEPGDSGSLLLTEDGLHPIGLLCAGSSMATVHNRIQNVMEILRLTL